MEVAKSYLEPISCSLQKSIGGRVAIDLFFSQSNFGYSKIGKMELLFQQF
jgi:hypothetical protein